MHTWTCDRATICNILVYHACNDIETTAIHCNQQTVWYLDPLLNSLHIWLYHIFQNVLDPFLTKIYIIWICLDACKLYSSTKWPLKQCHWIYNIFASFLLSLIPHGLGEYFYPGFMWIGTGNSLKMSQNRIFLIRTFGTDNGCKLRTAQMRKS
jgi:hypothetical protein